MIAPPFIWFVFPVIIISCYQYIVKRNTFTFVYKSERIKSPAVLERRGIFYAFFIGFKVLGFNAAQTMHASTPVKIAFGSIYEAL